MKRREFIHDLSHAAALSAFMPAFDLQNVLGKASMLDNTREKGNILIIIKLNGGNDGLNTVVPLDQYGNLTQVRPHVILPEKNILRLTKSDLGLHPSLSGLKSLYDENRLKIIQNVGYDNPSLSHFRSMDIWQTASDYGTFLTSGWVGRYVENRHPNFPDAYPNENFPHPLAIELPWQNSLSFTGEYSFPGFLVQDPQSYDEILNELDHIYSDSYSGNKLKYIQMVTKQSNLYSGVIREAYMNSEHVDTGFPDFSTLGDQFRRLSRLIRGGLNTRLYMLESGGWDTHEKQVDSGDHTKGVHANLLQDLNDSIMAFMKSIDASGDSDRVMIMTFSEFGRRIASTASGGTDHGTAAPMFLIGSKLNHHVLGKNPVISPNTQWQDNLEPEFDFRQVYASVIEQWMGSDDTTEKQVLRGSFSKLPITGEYLDADGDGVFDKDDLCNDTPAGVMVDATGCQVFSLPSNTFSVVVSSASCIGQKSGRIRVSSSNSGNNYSYALNGVPSGYLNQSNNFTSEITDLSAGLYEICFTVDGIENYSRCYSVSVTEPASLSAVAAVNYEKRELTVNLSGSKLYRVVLNGRQFTAENTFMTLPLKMGNNTIEITTDLECQGRYLEQFFISEEVKLFPNPTKGLVEIYIGGSDKVVTLKLSSLNGKTLLSEKKYVPLNRIIEVDLFNRQNGMYIISLEGFTTQANQKVIKE